MGFLGGLRGKKEPKKKPKIEEKVETKSELERLCEDPKYYQYLPEEYKEKITDIQQGLYSDLTRLPFENVLNQKKTIGSLLKGAEGLLKEAAKIRKDATKLETELKKEEKYKVDQRYRDAQRKDGDAAELFRQAATLGLFRKEIRTKINPNATDVDVKDIKTYFEKAKELGYPISYSTVIQYLTIAREIVSDRHMAYQPKVEEKKKQA